jgi:hypothetical protein
MILNLIPQYLKEVVDHIVFQLVADTLYVSTYDLEILCFLYESFKRIKFFPKTPEEEKKLLHTSTYQQTSRQSHTCN